MMATDKQGGPKQASPMAILLATTYVEALGFGLVVPVLPRLLEHVANRDATHTATIYGLLLATPLLIVLLSSQFIGNLSDRYGRRVVLLLSLGGSCVVFGIQAFANSLWMLFLARACGGLCSGNRSVAAAFVADVTPPARRAVAYGQLNAAYGVGLICGPALGGWLSVLDLQLPFLGAAGLAVANLLIGVVALPESLSPQNRRKFTWRKSSPISAMSVLRRCTPFVRSLLLAVTIEELALAITQSILILFMQYQLRWNPLQMGVWLGSVGVGSAVVQLFLVRPTLRTLGEQKTVRLGIATGVIALVGAVFIRNSAQMYALALAYCLVSLVGPAYSSLLVNAVGGKHLGELQGTRTGMESIASILGAPLGAACFAYCSRFEGLATLPGAAFLLGACVLIPSLLITTFAFRNFNSITASTEASI